MLLGVPNILLPPVVQVTGFRLPFNRQWGAGVLSVMGVSFTTVSIAISVVSSMMVSNCMLSGLPMLPWHGLPS